MMSKTFEEFYSELNSMNTQDINNALVEASINFEKCTEPFTAQDIIKQQQETINRQKAEIERLQKENEQFAYIGKLYSEIKAEAVKEFAELLNKEAENVCIDPEGDFVETDDKIYDTVANWCRATSDKLLKETVGEG